MGIKTQMSENTGVTLTFTGKSNFLNLLILLLAIVVNLFSTDIFPPILSFIDADRYALIRLLASILMFAIYAIFSSYNIVKKMKKNTKESVEEKFPEGVLYISDEEENHFIAVCAYVESGIEISIWEAQAVGNEMTIKKENIIVFGEKTRKILIICPNAVMMFLFDDIEQIRHITGERVPIKVINSKDNSMGNYFSYKPYFLNGNSEIPLKSQMNELNKFSSSRKIAFNRCYDEYVRPKIKLHSS